MMQSLHSRAVPGLTRLLAVAALFYSGAACSLLASAEPKVKTPAEVVVVQGADQTAQAGRDLPTMIVFRVLDSAGVAIVGVPVSLSVASGGGAVTPASDTTDARGEFKAKWT